MTLAVNIAQTGSNNTTFRNRIINGAMVIDQRNAGASVTPTNGQYLVDRFTTALTQASKFTAQQSTIAPVGFTKSLKITSSSAYSVLSTDYFGIGQVIEGFNVADMGWGTANAKTVTLSFQVYSSLTGTFGGAIFNDAANRSYPFTYTISSANTWTTASVTIAGDTTGTWATNNSGGMKIYFNLGTGSTYSGTAGAWAGTFYLSATGATSVVGTNGATWYVTGVQLEAGSTASSFEYRSYGTELALCQRYCFRATSYDLGRVQDATYTFGGIRFPVTMRASASYTASSGTYTVNAGSAGTPAFVFASTDTMVPYNVVSNWTATAFVQISATFTAEL